MVDRKNKGFSMVEVIIALAIFSILMISIVSSIVYAVNKNSQGKELQYRNQLAQNLLEYIKEDSIENIQKKTYFEHADYLGSSDVSVDTQIDDPASDEPIKTVIVTGTKELGTKHTPYSYLVEISNASHDYHKKETNPEKPTLGTVENMDLAGAAVISGTFTNYDGEVFDTFVTRKLKKLQEDNPELFASYTQQEEAANIFSSDRVTRTILVKLSKVSGSVEDGTAKYEVVCTLKYEDNSSYLSSANNTLEYTPYTKQFDYLPNVYLMYNTCVYNGYFSITENIVFDNSAAGDSRTNMYVVETAENYSTDLSGMLDEDSSSELNKVREVKNSLVRLYNQAAKSGSRESVQIHLRAAGGSNLDNLYVYHNFEEVPSFDTAEEAEAWANRKNKKNINVDIGNLPAEHVGGLNDATKQARGLYTVKVWMGDSLADVQEQHSSGTQPLLTGTKEGD